MNRAKRAKSDEQRRQMLIGGSWTNLVCSLSLFHLSDHFPPLPSFCEAENLLRCVFKKI